MSESAATPQVSSLQADDGTPPVPMMVEAGGWILRRAPGEFPDDVLFAARGTGGHTLWLKAGSAAGPWDWILDTDNHVIDFNARPFPTLAAAAADLADTARAFGVRPFDDDEAADLAPVEALRPQVSSTDGRDSSAAADPELLRLALDVAIVSLTKVRARL